MLRRPALVILAVTVAALAGCGTTGSGSDSTDKFQGEQRLVANTVEDLESAASKGDGDQDKICRDLLSQELTRKLTAGGRTCQAAVDTALKNADQLQLEVQSVRITGADATARVKAERGDRDEMVDLGLTKQGAGWRIDSFGS